jgi:hypothetical protein
MTQVWVLLGYDTDRVLMRGGDFDGGKATFLRDDTGARDLPANVAAVDQRIVT